MMIALDLRYLTWLANCLQDKYRCVQELYSITLKEEMIY